MSERGSEGKNRVMCGGRMPKAQARRMRAGRWQGKMHRAERGDLGGKMEREMEQQMARL